MPPCHAPAPDILRAATDLVTGAGNCTYAGRGQTFAYTGGLAQQGAAAGPLALPAARLPVSQSRRLALPAVSQQPSLAGCWSSVAGAAAGGLLSAIQPITILSQAPGGALPLRCAPARTCV